MKVVWSAEAVADLGEIAAFISSDSPVAARRTVERIRAAARAIPAFPALGRQVPEYGQPAVRERLVGAYRLIYRLDPGEAFIMTVIEGHRLLPEDSE